MYSWISLTVFILCHLHMSSLVSCIFEMVFCMAWKLYLNYHRTKTAKKKWIRKSFTLKYNGLNVKQASFR